MNVTISLPIVEAAQAVGLGRRYLEAAISRGDLTAHKAGTKTLIGVDDLRDWFASLPVIEKKSA